jgi:hypothetical protein
MKFDCYADPQHGWLKVKRILLIQLKIEHKITSCSYQRGDWVYLEEDVDAGTFIEAFKATGKTVEFRAHHTNRSSRLRNYDCFVPTTQAPPKTGNYGLVMRFDGGGAGIDTEVRVYVGDYVGFKSDYEQSGKITKIQGNGRRARLTLHNPNGFGGEYLRYDTETQVDADDCWVD